MWYGVVLVAIAAFVIVINRNRARPAAAPAAAEPGQPTSIYAAIAPLNGAFEAAAHPLAIDGHPALLATLGLMRGPEFDDATLVHLAIGDHAGLRMAALLAIAERGQAFTQTPRLVAMASSMSPWMLWYALRAIAACAPPAEPVVGRVMVNISIDAGGRGWSGNPLAVETMREFIRGRQAGGEEPAFAPAEMALIVRHDATFDLRRTLERIGTDVTVGWLNALGLMSVGAADADGSDPDDDSDDVAAQERRSLAELGRVWDNIPSSTGRRLIETPAVAAIVTRLQRSLDANPARPCVLVGEPGVGKRAVFEALALRLREQ